MRKQKIGNFLLFSLIAFSIVVAAFPTDFEISRPGYRKIFLIFALWTLLTIGFSWTWEKIIQNIWQASNWKKRMEIIGFSIGFSILLIFMVPIKLDHYFNFLLPLHTLEIHSLNGEKDTASLLTFNVTWGKLPTGKIDLPFIWKGKPGSDALLVFYVENSSQPTIRVIWDGNEQIIDLASSLKKGSVVVKKYFLIPFYHTLIYTCFLLVSLSGALFWVTVMLIAIPALPGSKKAPRLYWLAIPMLAIWMIYLLAFWPGQSSYDTMQQWREAQSGVFTDAHPALDTMFIALVSRVFPTPAAIAVIQIIVLALVTAWGLVELNTRGLPAWATWGLAFGFALLPVNSLIVITVWKDVLYGCAVFAMFIQFIKIAFSQGVWLESRGNQIGLILAGLASAFLRHNGFPVILASILVLFLLYRKQWRSILGTILVISAIYLLVQGPFYSFMKVKKYPGFINILMFDHIGAHIKAGTFIEKEDLTYLNKLIPIEKWPYVCSDSEIRNMDGPIPFDFFASFDHRPAQIAFNLFLKDPVVDLNHTLCASRLIWMIDPAYPIYTIPMTNTFAN